MPCYNEQDNIKELTAKWIKQLRDKRIKDKYGYEIVLVNDGSFDGTNNSLKKIQEKNEHITVITHQQNMGLGQVLRTGITYIEKKANENDVLCIMDADNTHDPCYIHSMLNKMKETGAECIIASRYQKGSKIIGVSWFRNLMSYGARLLYTVSLGIPNVKDYTCGYRIYKMKKIKKAMALYGDQFISETGFTCMVEILYKLYVVGTTFNEIPFELRYDLKKGASKMKVVKNAIKSIDIAIHARRRYRY